MFHDDFNKMIDRFTHGIVRRKVKQLIGRAGFLPHDRGDLEQELFARVLQSLPKFDADKAHRNKFITAVVERHVANILRNKQALKRDHRRISSLNVTIHVEGEGPIELGQTISQRELDARRGSYPRSDEELEQLANDVAVVIASLPNKWRRFAERCKSQNLTAISRDIGVPRTTLQSWVHGIRKRFEDAGLKDYL